MSYAYALRDQNRIVYADDETFYARLPDDLAEPLRATVDAQALSADENLEVFRILSGEFDEAGDVAIQLAPLNFQWCSDSALEQVAALSHERGALVHLHLLETPYQRAYARKRTGGSALGHLDRLGLLNERMTLGHGVWTTADDLDPRCRAQRRHLPQLQLQPAPAKRLGPRQCHARTRYPGCSGH